MSDDTRPDLSKEPIDELHAAQNAVAAILAEALIRSGALSMEGLRQSVEAVPRTMGLLNSGKAHLAHFLDQVEKRVTPG